MKKFLTFIRQTFACLLEPDTDLLLFESDTELREYLYLVKGENENA